MHSNCIKCGFESHQNYQPRIAQLERAPVYGTGVGCSNHPMRTGYEGKRVRRQVVVLVQAAATAVVPSKLGWCNR